MRAFVRWFEPAMDVDTILDREYNRVGEAEVIKLHQLILNLALFLEPALTSRREKDRQLRDFCD